MRVRARVVTGLSVAIVLLCVGLVLLIQQVVVRSFQRLDAQRRAQQVERLQATVIAQADALQRTVNDWANWDDTYEFVAQPNQQYIRQALNSDTLANIGVRDVLYIDSEGTLIYSAQRVSASQDVVEVPPTRRAAVLSVLENARAAGIRLPSGLTVIENEVVLLAVAEILPSQRDLPSRGMLAATVVVTPEILSDWTHQSNLTLNFWRLGQDRVEGGEAAALRQLQGGAPLVSSSHRDGEIQVFGLVRSIDSAPALLFAFQDTSGVTQVAEDVRNGAVFGVACAGLIVLLLLGWLIDRQVLRRLSSLSSTVQAIAHTGDADLRLRDPHEYRQSLQFRVFATVSCCFLLMGGAVWGIVESSLAGAFAQLERKNVEDELVRVQRVLDARAVELQVRAVDWAQRDATSPFMHEQPLEQINRNLSYETMNGGGVRAVAYLRFDGELLFGREVDGQRVRITPLSDPLKRAIQSHLSAVHKGATSVHTAGLVPVDDHTLALIAHSPVLDSAGDQQPLGSLVLVVLVDDLLGRDVRAGIRGRVHVEGWRAGAGAGERIVVLDSEWVQGRSVLTGVDGAPAGILHLTLPREAHLQGVAAQRTLVLFIALGSLFATMLAAVIVHRVIVAALHASVERINSISVTGDTSQRLAVHYPDELGVLAEQINSMLDSLARTQKELLKARDEAEGANRAKSTFIAKVSHELRTPIHGILGMLRILMREERSHSKRAHIGMAQRAALGLLETINDILDFSKVESGNLSLEATEFRLRSVIRDAVRTVAPRAEEKPNLELEVEVKPWVGDLFMGDPLRIKQCMVNLLGNSIKFTQGGFVRLEIDSSGVDEGLEYVVLRVRDSGVGIPEARLAKIFDPFTQADDSVARVYSGTGLGLTIVKQLVEEMHGQIEVQSQVQVGTTFTLTLPLSKLEDPEWCVPVDGCVPATIAFVHAGARSAQQLCAACSDFGVRGVEFHARDIARNLAQFLAQPPVYGAVVVWSEALQQPYILQLVERLVATEQVPVVALVSGLELGLHERLERLGVQHILVRPRSLEDILRALAGRLSELDAAIDGVDDDVLKPGSRKLRILVADDAETNRVILTSMLQDAGHEVLCVENGLELVSALKGQLEGRSNAPGFDIVLTDIQMPVMDGLSATRQIRALEDQGHGHIPIVAVTAHAMREEAEQMRASGVDEVVTKPIIPGQLARVLSAFSDAPARGRTPSAFVFDDRDDDEADAELAARGDEFALQCAEVAAVAAQGESRLKELLTAPEGIKGILDMRGVFLRAGGSERRIGLIVRTFLGSYEQPLGRLVWAAEDNDLVSIGRAAHALRGLLLEVGAVRAAAGAAALERAVTQGGFVQGPLISATEALAAPNVTGEVAQLHGEVDDAVRVLTAVSRLFPALTVDGVAAQGRSGQSGA